MEKQTKIIDYIVGLLDVDFSPELPIDGGYSIETVPTTADRYFLDKARDDNIDFLILGKSKNEKALADSLYKICNTLNNMTSYSNDIYSILTNTPSLVDKDGDYYIWECQLTVKFTIGGNN